VIAVFLVVWGLPQLGFTQPLISYSDWVSLAVFAAILALLNTFIRPLLVLLSLPLTCLTLGLFAFVINTLLFAVAGVLTPGFQVANFWGAFIGALAVSVVGVAVNIIAPPAR